jgi:hypothetical protein
MTLSSNHLTEKIYHDRYPNEMSYDHYLLLLEEGFEILNRNEENFENYKQLEELKSIRLALEYRLEIIAEYRKKRLKDAGFRRKD